MVRDTGIRIYIRNVIYISSMYYLPNNNIGIVYDIILYTDIRGGIV